MLIIKNIRNNLNSIAVALSTILAISLPASANAQIQAQEAVAATVNDNMISTFDVNQRMRLMILTSGGRIPEAAYPQLQKKALRDLIEEQLKLQEAERWEVEIDPEEIEEEMGRIGASVKATVPQLEQQLLSQNIAPDTLRSQIRSRLVWQRLVTGRYRSRVRINEDEVDSVMGRLRLDSQKEQYLISEICLPVEDEARTRDIYNAGMQMIDQMRKGAPFDALARQFSYCTSSANGGDRGWIRLGELPPELATVIEKLQEGTVSVPTPHDGMVYIMAVRQKRDAAVAGKKTFQLAYAGAPLSVGEDTARAAFERLSQTNVCDGDELGADLGRDIGVTMLPPVQDEQIQPQFRTTVNALGRGEVSQLIRTSSSYHAVMMCDLDEGLGLPSRDVIKDRLFAEQLDLIARRYLRDIERDSSVDVRVTSTAPTEDNS